MSRRGGARAANRTENPISLFPFLSVLICTMGTLILLLVVINRNARTQAAERAGIKPDEIVAELDVEARTYEMFAQDMAASKTQANAEIDDARARLATLDSVIENIVAEIQRKEKTLKELAANRGNTNSEIGKLNEQLAAKREALRRAEAELVEMQKNAGDQKKSYAIIPYRGIDGTERRPVYIECRGDCVILHPEGIVLKEDDFLTASHPDNPLDALLRAASLFYTENELVARGTKPYPLIIVRPSGIDSYYAVRESLQSWGEQFGYELVAEDWKLEFPQSNEALKHRLEMQLAASRERMIPVKAMMLQRYMTANRTNGNSAGRDIGRGGLRGNTAGESRGIANGSMPGAVQNDANRMPGQPPSYIAGHSPGGMASNQTGDVLPDGTLAHTGGNGAAEAANHTNKTSDGFSDVNWHDVMTAVGNQSPMSNGKKQPNVEYRLGPNGSMIRYEDGVPRTERVDLSKVAERQKATASAAGATADAPRPGEIRLQTTNAQPAYPQAPNVPLANSPFVSVGMSQAASQDLAAQNMAAQNNVAAQNAVPQPAYSAAGMTSSGQCVDDPTQTPSGGIPSLDMTFGDKETKTPKRGWAMQDIDFTKTEIVRPIIVECLPNRIVIKRVAGAGIDRTVDIPANEGLFAVGNTFASHILDYIDTWGNAARGTYWQPELNVLVHPGAEMRFEELKSLMHNSGLQIQRKQTTTNR